MFYDRSEPVFPQWNGEASQRDLREGVIPPHAESQDQDSSERMHHPSLYDRSIVDSVWEFAQIVPGNDAALWRKDEFGEWIHRLDYGRKDSEFGWEIFDPGVGRHTQGVFAMRPMQWQNFLKQFDVFA